ncbi:MAG: hypothetical protein KC438_03800, partial [Thermomicrobiales bacterium]|nr:hypothetical protein [Thermomicrobiales bacterium]
MKRIVLVLTMMLTLAGGPITAAQNATPVAGPDFSGIQPVLNDCSFLNRSGANLVTDDIGDIVCGTITVPENWSIPDGR